MRALAATSAAIAVSSYYAHKKRRPSTRAERDAELKAVIVAEYEKNRRVNGIRKTWHALNRKYQQQFGHIARCTVHRLMNELRVVGIHRRRKKPSTRSADAEECPQDLVDRDFHPGAANRLWVADKTYVRTQSGWVYTAFVMDACTRKIPGWQVTDHIRESLARDSLAMALAARMRAGEDVSGLIHHSDRGVRYQSLRYGQTLAESEVVASVGSRGDSYDNDMAEALNSLYKGELIDRQAWSGLVEVMAATSSWVSWYNQERLHSGIGYRTPVEASVALRDSEHLVALAA